MSNSNHKSRQNSFDKQIAEVDEWQKNATNPGYFVGSGKVPLPIKNSIKSPIALLIIGVFAAVPVILNLINEFSIENILSNAVLIMVSVGFIIGGIIRILNRF